MNASRREVFAGLGGLTATGSSAPAAAGTAGPGVCAVASRGPAIVFARTSGLADLEHRVALTPRSPVRIASLTKQFTAIAVLQLARAGRLDLDDTVAKLWSACPPLWRPLTVRQLLSQISGLTDDLTPLFAHIASDLSVDQILALYGDRPLLAPPGRVWRYSNLNYWILGKIIEIASGEAYADFIGNHVLAKGMSRTRYGSHAAIIADRALGYERGDDGGWVNARYFSANLGYSAGGFLSTAQDMVRWYAALSGGEVVSPAMLALALTEVRTSDGKPTGYGLGWYLSEFGGLRVAHHGGSTFGFVSYLYWVPSRGEVAAVFKNSSDDRGEPQAQALALLMTVLGLPRARGEG